LKIGVILYTNLSRTWKLRDCVCYAFIDSGAFSLNCYSWNTVGNTVYGSMALDEFIFDMGANGKAIDVQSKGLRVILERV
jgi:hypothetical protein